MALLAEADPEAALDYLSKLAVQEGLEGAYANVLSTLGQRDPAAAAEWLRTHPDLASLENWEAIFTAWAGSQPTGALNFLRTQLTPAQQEGLLPLLLARFSDPAFQQRLFTESDPVRLQQALPGAARAVLLEDPARALSLAGRLSDPQHRADLQEELLNDWFRRDPAAARAYANQAGLPDPGAP